MTKTVLVADDDVEIRDVVRIYLRNEGFRVIEAEDGLAALEAMRSDTIDLIILDIMMPNLNGLKTCMTIRESSNIPIIMLSAKGDDMDKIAGLTTGADDYLAKPFNPLELIARVKAQFRRGQYTGVENESPEDGVIRIDDLLVDRNRHHVIVRGKDIALTPIEFSILELLASHRGHVFNVEKIYRSVWKEDKFTSDNTVMVHIRNLREKIEVNPREPQVLKTVWGVGYKIE